MSNANDSFKYFGLIIDPKKESTDPLGELVLLRQKVIESSLFTASIIHDKDIDENGNKKLLHLHVFREYAENHTGLAVLRDFSKAYDLDKAQISFEGSNSPLLLLQYLQHKNQPKKHFYESQEIFTNDKEKYLTYFNTPYKSKEEIRIDILNDAETKTFVELVNEYGYDTISSMRPMIKEIKLESQSNAKELQRRANHLKQYLEELKPLFDRLITNCESGLTPTDKHCISLEDIMYEYERITDFYENYVILGETYIQK